MKTVNVSLVGVGGQGIILTSDLLALVASESGMDVKKSEIHGMSQRGGSVISQVRFGMEVASPIIQEGTSDVLVAFDRLEALRFAHLLSKDGKAIVATTDLMPVTVSSGQQQAVNIDELMEKNLPKAMMVDAAGIAQKVGNERCANMVVAGALSAVMPFKESAWDKAMEAMFTGRKAALLDVNREAFRLGREAVTV